MIDWFEYPANFVYKVVAMRTTVNIDGELLEEARRLTNIHEDAELVAQGLKALIARESARRLAKLGGSMPDIKPIPRRRSEPI